MADIIGWEGQGVRRVGPKSLLLLPLLLLLLLLPVLPAVSAAAVAQQVTLDDVRSDFAKGDFAAAKQKADKLLFASSMQQPASVDRYPLLMIKGESQLQLKDRLGAISAFKSAEKIAGDVNELAAAHANALIIDRSSSGRYMPRSGSGKEPIDILPMESRKQAMAALQADLSGQYKSQIDAALRADQLPPIEQVFTKVADMFFLETFVNGGEAKETGQVMRELGQHAFQLMQTEISRASRRVDQLNQIANSSGTTSRGWDTGRMGLTSVQRDEVKAMLPYLVKIRDRAGEYRRVAAKLGGNEQKWDALVANATDAYFDAESLFNDR
jgi:hypothetical protein